MLIRSCTNCGAPSGPYATACAYCGARASEEVELIVEPTFGMQGGWLMPATNQRQGITIDAGDGRELRVSMAAKDLAPEAMPVAWMGKSFVDLSVTATIRFTSPPCGAAGGFWLRASEGQPIVVLLWDQGRVSVSTNVDNRHDTMLARIEPDAGFRPGAAVRLSAALRGDILKVSRDRRPIGSFVVSRVAAGEAELRVQAGDAPTSVVFSDVVARDL